MLQWLMLMHHDAYAHEIMIMHMMAVVNACLTPRVLQQFWSDAYSTGRKLHWSEKAGLSLKIHSTRGLAVGV
jgi:hypothetical protein